MLAGPPSAARRRRVKLWRVAVRPCKRWPPCRLHREYRRVGRQHALRSFLAQEGWRAARNRTGSVCVSTRAGAALDER